jgi:mRNA interferase ChpB
MERGDIFIVSLDPIEGHEQAGERRVMVVTPAAFNRLTGVPMVVPITTGGSFARVQGFAVSLTGTGLRTVGVVRCDQVGALDLKARRARRIERAPDFIVEDVLARIITLFE